MGGSVSNYLEEQLKGNEICAFETIYNRQVNALNISENEKETRRIAISKIRNGDTKAVTPFIYALCTFEDSFIKLSDYVQAHIGNVNDAQKKILAIIASIHYYTGLEVPMVLLHRIIAETGRKSLENVLTKKQYDLLVICNEDVKTIHHSVSGELLKQICAYELNNKKAWKNKLKSVLKLVIKELTFFRSNDNVTRILKALFLNHQQSSNAGAEEHGHFSYAIDDLPTYVEKKEILEMLCDKFDTNPYVYSNMARYYHYVEEDEDTALEYIQQAMDIMEDYTFYHLKGIALAKRMRNYIQQNAREIKSDYSFFVRKLYDVLEDVEAAYDKSIELNVGNMPAYTSKMNYLLATVRDVQKYICPEISVAQMMKSEKHAWCNDYIAKVNETLENIRIVDSYMNMNHNNDIETYEAQVLSLEENLSEAISGWNNLLAKEAVYRPSIRRNLVNAYYRTCNKQWTTLNYEKGLHVRKLLMDNIHEEPEEANNIVQWFDYARNFESDLNKTIEFFQQYVSNPGLEYYYRAMLTFFAYGLENTDRSYIKRGMDFGNQCETLAREQPNRRRLLDVYNPMRKNLRKIELFKDYLSKTGNFDLALKLVPKVRGRIVRIDKPEMGWINLEKINVNIKFNPSYNPARIYRQTKDEGVTVEFVLGFRAEGAFAFAVTECTETF
jgi:hypothetical protein